MGQRSVITNSSREKTGSIEDVDSLAEQAAQLDLFVRQASADGESLDAVERHAFDQVLRMGHRAVGKRTVKCILQGALC